VPVTVPFERAAFFVEGAPVLLLPEIECLPALRLTEDGGVASCEGWRIMARMSFTIVDGPGDDGIVVRGELTSEPLMAWCESVDEHGGAVVLSFDGWDATTPPAELLEQALERSARGGSMPGVPPAG
jgi:hypothetical protein